MPSYEVVVIYFAKKAYALGIAAESIGQFGFGGYATHFGFRDVAKGKIRCSS